MFPKPIPFTEALDYIRSKQLLPTTAGTDQLADLPAEIRRLSVFSARTLNADYLQTIKDLTGRLLDPGAAGPGDTIDSATMRWKLKEALQALSYTPAKGEAGTLKDLSSDPRLNLIVRMQTESALGLGHYIRAADPAYANAWPAQELYRLELRLKKRDWPSRWAEAGGQFFDGRMIALKSDPIWTDISAFGNPYPPFDFGSGMWVRDISRAESVDLGLLDPGETPDPIDPSALKLDLAAPSTAGLAPDLFSALIDSMSGAAELIDGVLHLK